MWQHTEWLRSLGAGVSLFSQAEFPAGHALSASVPNLAVLGAGDPGKPEGEGSSDMADEPKDGFDEQQDEVAPPAAPGHVRATKRKRDVAVVPRPPRSGSSSTSTAQRASAGAGKRKGNARALDADM